LKSSDMRRRCDFSSWWDT